MYVLFRTASNLARSIQVVEASVSICRSAQDGDVRIASKPFPIEKIDSYVSNVKTSSKI